jgi:hypothetical protein
MVSAVSGVSRTFTARLLFPADLSEVLLHRPPNEFTYWCARFPRKGFQLFDLFLPHEHVNGFHHGQHCTTMADAACNDIGQKTQKYFGIEMFASGHQWTSVGR